MNNPINEVDENGYFVWWIVIAVVAVTAIAVGASIAGQAVSNNGKINVWQVLFDGLMGALGSLLMITGLGPLGMALWNGALGFYSSVGSQLINGVKLTEINWTNVLVATILGAASGSKGGIYNTNRLQKELNKIDDVKYARIMHCFIGPDGVDAIVKNNKPQAIKSLVKNSLYSSIRFNLYNFGNGIIFR